MKSIYKIPAFIGGVNEKVYKPLIVSFGPYHHKDNLKLMEENKKKALQSYVGNISEQWKLLQYLKEMENKFLEAYDSLDHELWLRDPLNSIEKMFAEDAAFMLQFIIQDVKSRRGENNDANTIVNLSQWKPFVVRDMLLLENQLPLFLLEQFVLYFNQCSYQDLIEYIVVFFNIDLSLDGFEKRYLHILHLYWEATFAKVKPPVTELTTDSRIGFRFLLKWVKRIRGKKPELSTQQSPVEVYVIQFPWAAAEMRDAGIQFVTRESKFFRDISFQRKLLKLPVLELDDLTESTLANLVAFERLHVFMNDTKHWVYTSYILFMRSLVQKEADVSILESKRLLVDCRTANDKTPVSDYFATISRNLRVQDLPKSDDLLDIIERIDKYCKKPSSRLHASFIRRFVQGNWPEVSIAAAIIIFVLTSLQTLFTILAYVKT